jgi:hypothetical protein
VTSSTPMHLHDDSEAAKRELSKWLDRLQMTVGDLYAVIEQYQSEGGGGNAGR